MLRYITWDETSTAITRTTKTCATVMSVNEWKEIILENKIASGEKWYEVYGFKLICHNLIYLYTSRNKFYCVKLTFQGSDTHSHTLEINATCCSRQVSNSQWPSKEQLFLTWNTVPCVSVCVILTEIYSYQCDRRVHRFLNFKVYESVSVYMCVSKGKSVCKA